MTPENKQPKKPLSPGLIIAIVAVAAVLVGWLVFSTVKANRKAMVAEAQMEQLQLNMAQEQLEREYADLNNEFEQFENSRYLE